MQNEDYVSRLKIFLSLFRAEVYGGSSGFPYDPYTQLVLPAVAHNCAVALEVSTGRPAHVVKVALVAYFSVNLLFVDGSDRSGRSLERCRGL